MLYFLASKDLFVQDVMAGFENVGSCPSTCAIESLPIKDVPRAALAVLLANDDDDDETDDIVLTWLLENRMGTSSVKCNS